VDLNYETGIAEREEIFNKMVREEAELKKLPEKYKRLIRDETEFMDLLRQAHAEHDEALQREGLT
jgi:tellurite resistance protein TerC